MGDRNTSYVVLSDQGEEGSEGGKETSPQSVCQRGHKVAGRRDQDGVVLCLVLWCLFLIVLVGILLAECLLFENLNGDGAEGIKVYQIDSAT